MKVLDSSDYVVGIIDGDRVIAENTVILLSVDGDYGYVRYLNADMPTEIFRCRLDKFRSLASLGYKARMRRRNLAIIPYTVTKQYIPGRLFILCHTDLSKPVADLFITDWKQQRHAKLNSVRRSKDDIALGRGWDKKLIVAIFKKWLVGKELVVTIDELNSALDKDVLEVRYSKEDDSIYMRLVDDKRRKSNKDKTPKGAIFRNLVR